MSHIDRNVQLCLSSPIQGSCCGRQSVSPKQTELGLEARIRFSIRRGSFDHGGCHEVITHNHHQTRWLVLNPCRIIVSVLLRHDGRLASVEKVSRVSLFLGVCANLRV